MSAPSVVEPSIARLLVGRCCIPSVKSKLSSVALSIGALSLLAGCMSPPNPPVDQSTPSQWLHTHAGDASTAAAPITSQDLQGWWKRFGDAQLDALVDEALAQNLTLAQAVGQLKEQRILLGVATAPYLPQFTAGIRTLQDVAAVDSYFHASIDMTWELGLFGAMESNKLASYGELLGAQAQVRSARVELIANVVQRHLDIRVAQRQLALLDEREALEQRRMKLAQVRVDQRIGDSDAVHQVALELSQVHAQRATLEESQARAAHALAALLGRTEPDPQWLKPDANARLPDAQALNLQVLPADMLRTRAQIQAAQAQVESAAAKLGLSRSALYPRFALSGSLLYSYNLTKNLRSRSDRMPLLGPVIDIPLFDWNRRRSQVEADEVAMDVAVKAYRQSVLEGVADVETALAGLQAQTRRMQSLAGTQKMLASREQVLEKRRQLGLASESNLLDEKRVILQNASEQGIAQGAHALAYVALYKALGGAPLPEQDLPASESARP